MFEYTQSTPEQVLILIKGMFKSNVLHQLAALAPEELWRREQDLFRRERETAEREEELFAQWSKGGRLPNWPPFWPVIHQSIRNFPPPPKSNSKITNPERRYHSRCTYVLCTVYCYACLLLVVWYAFVLRVFFPLLTLFKVYFLRWCSMYFVWLPL